MNFNIRYKFPKRDDNIKMRYLYHIQCDPGIVLGKHAISRITCACQACRLSLKKLQGENFDADNQPCY